MAFSFFFVLCATPPAADDGLFFCLYSQFRLFPVPPENCVVSFVSRIERPPSAGEWMNGKSYLVGGNGRTSHFTSAQLFTLERLSWRPRESNKKRRQLNEIKRFDIKKRNVLVCSFSLSCWKHFPSLSNHSRLVFNARNVNSRLMMLIFVFFWISHRHRIWPRSASSIIRPKTNTRGPMRPC